MCFHGRLECVFCYSDTVWPQRFVVYGVGLRVID